MTHQEWLELNKGDQIRGIKNPEFIWHVGDVCDDAKIMERWPSGTKRVVKIEHEGYHTWTCNFDRFEKV